MSGLEGQYLSALPCDIWLRDGAFESGIGTFLPLNAMGLGLAALLRLLPLRLFGLAGMVVSALAPTPRCLLPLPESVELGGAALAVPGP